MQDFETLTSNYFHTFNQDITGHKQYKHIESRIIKTIGQFNYFIDWVYFIKEKEISPITIDYDSINVEEIDVHQSKYSETKPIFLHIDNFYEFISIYFMNQLIWFFRQLTTWRLEKQGLTIKYKSGGNCPIHSSKKTKKLVSNFINKKYLVTGCLECGQKHSSLIWYENNKLITKCQKNVLLKKNSYINKIIDLKNLKCKKILSLNTLDVETELDLKLNIYSLIRKLQDSIKRSNKIIENQERIINSFLRDILNGIKHAKYSTPILKIALTIIYFLSGKNSLSFLEGLFIYTFKETRNDYEYLALSHKIQGFETQKDSFLIFPLKEHKRFDKNYRYSFLKKVNNQGELILDLEKYGLKIETKENIIKNMLESNNYSYLIQK